MAKVVLITGISSGFGKAIAFRLAGLGYNIVITGRRAERLNELTQQLIEKYPVKVLALCFDVRDNEACTNAIKSLPVEFANIDLLINNAGLAAGASAFQDSDLADFEQMIDTNVKGLLYITKLIIP